MYTHDKRLVGMIMITVNDYAKIMTTIMIKYDHDYDKR